MTNPTTISFYQTFGVNPEDHPQWDRQVQLEEEMRVAGIERFKAQLAGNVEADRETSSPSVRRLMIHAHEKVVEGIAEFLAEAEKAGAGRRHTAVAYLRDFDKDIAAHLALRSMLDTVSQGLRVTNAAVRVASLIEDELFFDAYKEANPQAYKRSVQKIVEKSSNAQHRKRSMVKHAANEGVEWQDWPVDTKVKIGLKLIEIVVEKTGLFELVRQSEGANNTPIYLRANPTTIEWLASENARLEPMAPVYLPTLMPPRPWTTPTKGGYWTGRVRNLRMIKTHNRTYLEDLGNCDLSEVYDALNSMQQTAWQINRPVYDVMTHLWDNQSTLGKLPQPNDQPLPDAPLWLEPGMKVEAMTEGQAEEFGRWKSERAAIYESNAKSVAKRLQFGRMLWVAERFKDEEEFYFPHQLDFRGRCYAVPLFLTPQGNDLARGLLTFANAVPIGDQDGADWLAIHGAGLWGVDKCSMEERVAWVVEHQAEILASAENPYDNRFWNTAEKPWQALAFCLEWAGYVREGFDYLSALPVQMDGTCNGLQNFSAMLLDEIGGAAVNLVPAETPNDVYATVADAVSVKLREIAATDLADTRPLLTKEGEEVQVPSDGFYARAWLAFGVTRKVTKRPVMTLAYGASEFGFRQQVYDDTVEPWKSAAKKGEGPAFPFEGSGFQAASFLGALIWDTVGEVVVAARGAMDWLQDIAKVAAEAKLPVVWTTPTGLKVMQEYTTSQQKKLDLTFQKVRLTLKIDIATKTIDKRKQSSGISPNWVHSMDAAHMQKTVNRCRAAGMQSFSLIHDSYGTHAGNAWAMAQYLREEFVAMYGNDVLAQFRDEIAMMLPDAALPELPPKGRLDLNQVLESRFFFA